MEENPGIGKTPSDAATPVATPRDLKLDDPAFLALLRRALGQAIIDLRHDAIDWTRPWGVSQYIETTRGRVPVPGGASGDVYNSMYSVVAPGKGHMIPTLGTSYIQILGFDDDWPVAPALPAYSESSDPASPHLPHPSPPFRARLFPPHPFSP